jgi:glycosyltransferase involved in cell wall biosynthesis
MDLQSKKLTAVYVSREFEQPDAAAGAAPGFDRPSPRELLWVGRLVPSKNVAFLIRAVARLKSPDWVLNVCNDGTERARLEELAASLELGARVRFLGHVEDLAAVYRRASLLLTASVLEQYSLTVMEAYAFGVPVIGLRPDWKTVFNGNEDQIEDGVTGYLVADEGDMAARVDELLNDEPLRQRMARAAYGRKQSGPSFERYFAAVGAAVAAAIAGRSLAGRPVTSNR